MEVSSSYAPCLFCTHLENDFKCKAFPNGIPNEILSGENNHTEPLPEQKNDVVFELKDLTK